MSLRPNGSLLAASIALLSSPALAQQGPRDRQTRSLITNAMEDYQNLEIDRAAQRLQIALRGCGTTACSPPVMARVQMSIGVVAVGGQQDNAAGIEAMVRALQLDPNAEPDPLLTTPEISAAFRQAQARAARGGPTRPSHRTTELLHTPAPEQLENTPLPVYVEASGLTAERVYVFFRGNGMRAFERREMTRIANGWGTEIPCANVIQGNIEYYVSAQDASGAALASAGSESSPVQVTVVTRRTAPAPALPGRMPPETCAGDVDECPPGMSGPRCRPRGNARRGGLGDACTSNAECGEGMRCEGGACAVGDAEETPSRPSAPTDRFARFSIDVGGGIGLAYLGGFTNGGSRYAEFRRWVYQYTNAEGAQIQEQQFTPEDNCAGGTYCANVVKVGFSPTFFLSALVRYNVSRRVGVGLGVRFQFDAAPWDIPAPRPYPPSVATPRYRNPPTTTNSNPMANLLVSARLYYAFTPNGFAPEGLVASVFFGGGGGQIEPRPALPASVTQPGAHLLSGYGNLQLGTRVEYGLRNGFHVGAEVALQFMFPTFLFDIDVTPFVGFHI